MLPDVDLSLLIGLRTTLEEELWNHESESTMRDKLYSFLNIIYFLAVLGLHCCSGVSSSCGEQELLSSCGLHSAHCKASLDVGHRL